MELVVIGVIELSSIAIGIKTLDEMVKIAPIKIIDARTICPGKYIIVFSGDVASVEFAYNKGIEIGNNFVIDHLFLPQINQQVVAAIGKIIKTDEWSSIGIIETKSITSSIEAADFAAKAGGVKIIEVRLAIGFGGKSYVKFMGTLDEVEAAIEAGTYKARLNDNLVVESIIPQPHEEIKPFFI